MKYFLPKLALIFFLLVCFTKTALGQEEISSAQNVTYQVLESGTTRVKHEVTLTNLTTSYYATEYTLTLGFVDLKNITAFDGFGPLKKEIKTEGNGTEIQLFFNEKVVGKGNAIAFVVQYETDEIASKNGHIREIIIPKIKDSPTLTGYTARLMVPPSFGKLTYSKPARLANGSVADSSGNLIFSKEDVQRGISIAFGSYQLFDYELSYHLHNSRLYAVVTEIALPPTTAYQEVLLDSLEPRPVTVGVDKDGNWMARYRIEAAKKLDIKAKGKAKLFYEPTDGKKEVLSAEKIAQYTKPLKNWETGDPLIAARAKELKDPRAIYDFVVKTLSYDYSRIDKNLPRAGAASVLQTPNSAICVEFTDLFIALARAAGIPAREVDGFAYTSSPRLRPLSLVKDILHAWPQYYDQKEMQWISVDPTWGATSGVDYFDTFDFNHIAFVMKGFDSTYPSPPGSYKEAGDIDKKDVKVSFSSDAAFVPRPHIQISTSAKATLIAGVPLESTILLENLGNGLFSENDLQLSSDNIVLSARKMHLEGIPPFGKLFLPIGLRSPSYFDNYATVVKANIKDQSFSYTVQIVPLYLVYLPQIAGGIFCGIAFFLARFAWRVHIQRQQRGNSLRGQGKKP